MKIKVWVVGPCTPDVFGTKAEAEKKADDYLRGEWAIASIPGSYPGDWRTALERLVKWNGPEWGTYEITSHEVDVPLPSVILEALRAARDRIGPHGYGDATLDAVIRALSHAGER